MSEDLRVLITCPPMIKLIELYKDRFINNNIKIFCPEFEQIVSEDKLVKLVGDYDGWIIGDDPATRRVFEAGVRGRLKACVKWGVGVDNIDFDACRDLGIQITNTPGMFGNEVADVTIGYILGLARDLFYIDQYVKNGVWVKPTGISLGGKKVCLVGFGDIGRNIAKRLVPFGVDIWVSDPGFIKKNGSLICLYNKDIIVNGSFKLDSLDTCMEDADFVVISCVLNKNTYHMIDKKKLLLTKKGVRLINVSRGGVVNNDDVVELLESGHIYGVAFDVFEIEPLPLDSKLRNYPKNIFGTHNGSNSLEAVVRTSNYAIDILFKYLGV